MSSLKSVRQAPAPRKALEELQSAVAIADGRATYQAATTPPGPRFRSRKDPWAAFQVILTTCFQYRRPANEEQVRPAVSLGMPYS